MASGASEIQSVSKTEKAQNASWLLNIMDDQFPVPSKPPRIQKVARILRDVESNKGCFDPLVVSFGPCHHNVALLRPMERFKLAAAHWFVRYSAGNMGIAFDQRAAKNVYFKFVEQAQIFSNPRACYDDGIVKKDDEFMKMMFLDGCFILFLINSVVTGESDEALCNLAQKKKKDESDEFLLSISSLERSLIVRDMFLLENQIPYAILEALMSLMRGKNEPHGSDVIKRFIEKAILHKDKPSSSSILHKDKPSSFSGRFACITKLLTKFSNIFTDMNMSSSPNYTLLSTGGGSNSTRKEEEQHKPIHLLDFLRLMLVGKDESPRKEEEDETNYKDYRDYKCRSICKELKAAGIKLKRNKTNNLTDITFGKCGFQSYLYLPRLEVDDHTKSYLLNLVACEMCSDFSSECVVTSYVCFLESLIDHAEDVKELRSENILVHGLGSDKEEAKLFNEVGTYLVPDRTYSAVMKEIDKHSQSHVKVWIGEIMHTHFSSPWTVIALLAAAFVIILTLIQTIYTVGSYFKDE